MNARPRTTFALLALAACAVRREPSASRPPAPPPPATSSSASQADASVADAPVIPGPATMQALEAWARADGAIQTAYDALEPGGMTPDTLAAFQRAVGSGPVPVPVEATSLLGAISDDGKALVVQLHGRTLTTYIADATTGKLRGRIRGGGHFQDANGKAEGSHFLSGTHLLPIRERAVGRVSDTALVVRDLDDGRIALRAAPLGECPPAQTGDRVAYVAREGGTARVHVWDARTRTEVDDFAAPSEPRWEGCLRLVTPSLVGVAWAGSDGPRGFLLRNVAQKADLAQVAGGAYGPPTALSPDARFLAVGATPDQRTDRHPPPGKTTLVDAKTGATVATSDACTSPGSFAFDARSQTLVAGDLTDLCVFAVPSLKLLKRSAPLRPPFASGPWKITQTISDVRFFGEAALLASTQDGIFALFGMPSGALVWKGEHGRWLTTEGVGANAVAHAFGATDDGDRVVMDRHVRATRALRVVEEKGPGTMQEAWRLATPEPLRSALSRVASQACYAAGELYPRELCPSP